MAADPNRLLATLQIHAGQLRHNLPQGSEIEVEAIIDQSQTFWVKSYVPLLDEEFEGHLKMS